MFSSNCKAAQTSSLVGHAHAHTRGRHLQMVSDQNTEYRLIHSCHICIMQSTPRDLANLYESVSVHIKLSKLKAVCTMGSRTSYPLKNISQNVSKNKMFHSTKQEMRRSFTVQHHISTSDFPAHITLNGRKRG